MTRLARIALAACTMLLGCDRRPAELAPQPAIADSEDDDLQAAEEPAAASPATAPCGDAARCHALGLQAERTGQAARAAEHFADACDLEHGQACFRLGEMLRDGRGLPPDEQRSTELFTRGCRYGSANACDALGH